MPLSERKKDILLAVIRMYLETGEPVGSRTISKLEGVDFSPATIRNEMSDLEELGYIFSPHTSAGRIPTDKGYRFYVDTLMAEKEQKVTEMKELVLEKAGQMEKLLQQAAKVLAVNTNYATMIAAPKNNRNKIKFIQLSELDDLQLLIVIVSEGNIVRNKVIKIRQPFDNEIMLKLNMLLNTYLNGLRMEDINLTLMAKLKEQAGDQSDIIGEIMTALIDAVQLEDIEVYTSGATNILKYPELRDKETASELLAAFEEKQELAELFSRSVPGDGEYPIQVYIGDENSSEAMKDCSVVTATYELDDGLTGTIGIVGPKRMDYRKVMDTLKTLKAELDTVYHSKE